VAQLAEHDHGSGLVLDQGPGRADRHAPRLPAVPAQHRPELGLPCVWPLLLEVLDDTDQPYSRRQVVFLLAGHLARAAAHAEGGLYGQAVGPADARSALRCSTAAAFVVGAIACGLAAAGLAVGDAVVSAADPWSVLCSGRNVRLLISRVHPA
jgi:hypothetical protein